MNQVADFFTQHIDVVYFVYGLAFFSMGLAIMLESGRSSKFRLARSMGSLAAFGILHGLHEWWEMFERLGKLDALNPDQFFFLEGVRIGILVLSFLMLVVFGIRLIYSNRIEDGDPRPFAITVAAALAFFWLGSVLLTRWAYQPDAAGMIGAADVLSRYITAIPGALLAAWAIVVEQRAFRVRGMPDFGRALWWAAIALILYGVVGQVFTRPNFLFPANTINSELFLQVFGLPVQLFRAFMAAVTAVFVTRALRVFEIESRQQLQAANEARIAAQQTTLDTQRNAQRETEQLNWQLQAAVQDLSMLFAVTQDLTATLDKEQLLMGTLLRIIDNLPRIEGGLIMLREKPAAPLELVASYGFQGQIQPDQTKTCSFDRARILAEFIVETGQLALCTGGEMVPLGRMDASEIAGMTGRPVADGHTVGLPLIIRELVSGSLVLSASPETDPFSYHDISLLSTVGGQLSIALENAMLYQEVQEREALRGELLHQVVSAQEHERQRIARELHDGTGQMLTALGLGLAAVTQTGSDTLLQKQLSELRTMSANALQEVHEVIADLRPSVLDNLGLVSALRSHVNGFANRLGIEATISIKGERRRLDPDVETIIFRIVQETLTNVAKHAAADSVHVSLEFFPGDLALTITDDGVGFEPHIAMQSDAKGRHAWGLLGIQERAALVGGSCEILSQPGQGSTIRISIPLTAKERENEQDQINVGR